VLAEQYMLIVVVEDNWTVHFLWSRSENF
jgi:hypothetical protein